MEEGLLKTKIQKTSKKVNLIVKSVGKFISRIQIKTSSPE